MGLFTNSPKESAEIRGVPDERLSKLSNEQIICLALARLYEAEGVDDDALIDELYRRGRAPA